MATLANRPRSLSSRLHRTYRLEMGGKSVMLLLGLLGLTGLVLFYMGIVTGMGMRQPAVTEEPTPGGGREELAAHLRTEPESLAFNRSLLADKPVVEDLLQDQEQVARQTAAILARAQRELSVEQVPIAPIPAKTAKPEPQAKAAASNPVPPAPSNPAPTARVQPAPPPNPASAGKLYTVQVFSSKSEANARALMVKLSRLGFSPYLNRFQDAQRETWYRVRVGKASQADAERLKSRLKNEANLKKPRVIQL